MARKRYSDEDILKLLGEIELNIATAHVFCQKVRSRIHKRKSKLNFCETGYIIRTPSNEGTA